MFAYPKFPLFTNHTNIRANENISTVFVHSWLDLERFTTLTSLEQTLTLGSDGFRFGFLATNFGFHFCARTFLSFVMAKCEL